MANTPRRPRSCEVCGEQYRPTYYKQRACGRTCGATLKRIDGIHSWPASAVAWRQCGRCSAWYTARSGRRCTCAAYRPTSGEQYIMCSDCSLPFVYPVVTRRPSYCDTCRALRLAQSKRDRRAQRKARQRGVQTEPVNVRRVYDRDRWQCGLCRKRVDASLIYPHPLSASLDHVLPLARGGAHSMANVQLAHLRCNLDKRDGGTQQLALIG